MRIALLALTVGVTAGVTHVHGETKAARRVSLQEQQKAPPTSFELIDDALAKRAIDTETAHKYRVFAAFGDSRLPAAYQGDDSRIDAMPPSVMRVARFLPTFSPQTRAELEPFFKRPDEPGSWLELANSGARKDEAAPAHGPNDGSDDSSAGENQNNSFWRGISAANGKVFVWFTGGQRSDSLKAVQVAQAITNPIWPKLTTLFWYPVSDGGTAKGVQNGPEFDVYLFPFPGGPVVPGLSWRGGLWPADPANECVKSPRYIGMDSRYAVGGPGTAGMVQGVAGLLTGAIALSRHLRQGDCALYDWILQATMTWAEHFVYPLVQTEQPHAPYFLDYPAQALDAGSDARHQGAYVFPFFLQVQGLEKALPAMWREFEQREPLDGIDWGLRSIGKKLEDVFPEFAVANWNRRIAGSYWSRDSLRHSAAAADSIVVTVPAGGRYEEKLDLGMPYLSAMNYYFKFDTTVQTVTFENTVQPVSHARVWAIERLKGRWQKPYPFSQGGKTWCRAAPGQELDELVLVFSNVQWQYQDLTVDPGSDPPVLSADRSGCDGWIGTDSVTNTMTSNEMRIVETVVSQLEFDVDSALVLPGTPREYWKSVRGTITWRATATGRRCNGQGGGTETVPNLKDDHVASLNIWNDGGKMRVSGTNGPWPGSSSPFFTVRCSDGTTYPMPLVSAVGFFQTDPDKNELAPNGKSFSGNFRTQSDSTNSARHIYSFKCTNRC